MTGPVGEFTVDGPLPGTGRLALEASAGTGKTYALSALSTRLLAEGGVTIDQLLVVTFTRAAAAELRDRIRRRVVGAARFLRAAGPLDAGDDEVHRVLAQGGPADRAERSARLERAVADFDTATITTIHGFCTQVLATLGATGDHNPDAVMVQDTADLVAGACADLRARVAFEEGEDVGRSLTGWVNCALNNPSLRIEAASGTAKDEHRRDLVRSGADAVRERLVRTGSISYDGLLEAVRVAVTGSPAVAERLAAQFPVALIDEFQDTDPVQWDIFRTIYSTGDGEHRPGTRVVVVGDPKQAIYGFRGGDIHTYLDAVAGSELRTLATNWRSDGPVLSAMNALGEGWELGDALIPYRPVRPAPGNEEGRLHDARGRPLPAMEIRCAVGPGLPVTRGGIQTDAALNACVEDLVDRLQGLLRGRAAIDGVEVAPGDIAVLVHANRWAPQVQRALARAGIPSVVAGGSNVAESVAADQWRILLDALVRPADPTRARAVALSWFGGWAAGDVWETARPHGDDAQLTELQSQLEGWSGVLRSRGVSALLSAVWSGTGLAPRVLAEPGGERNLTDLEHLGELLHGASGGRPVGPESLRALLDGLRVGEEEDPEAIKRRIDTDASSVTIMTLHASKGLEFPIVCVPSLWNLGVTVRQRVYRDEQGPVLDVSSDGRVKAVKPVHELAKQEVRGQNLRLAYVGLTRARHQTIVWWSPASGAASSPIAPFLFGAGGGTPPPPEDTVAALRERVAGVGADAWIEVSPTAPPEDHRRDASRPTTGADGVDTTGAPDAGGVGGAEGAVVPAGAEDGRRPGDLVVAALRHPIDRSAGRWSFTAATRRADDHDDHDRDDQVDRDRDRDEGDEGDGHRAPRPAGDPDDPSLGDAGDADEQVPPPPVLFDGLGAGAAFGTLVHTALEHLDFTADVDDQLRASLDVPWSSVPAELVPRLVAAISASVHTPLGAAFGGARLADVAATDRLDELDFELPLGRRIDRDRPSLVVPVSAAGIGAVLVDHLDDRDPVRAWATRLADGSIPVELGGFLTGSVDLVMRLPTPDGADHRFCIVDYKTNRLGSWGVPDTVANYHPDLLPLAMASHHYPLQAVLYSVALHRYLRWRLPSYRPEVHLGPVGYLFVRGMVGPDTPAPGGGTHGVFAWTPPSAAVAALSDLLHGGPA